jgi:hypothetical protein
MGPTRVAVALAAAASLVVSCGVGTGTLRISDAEAEIITIAAAVVDGLGLDVPRPIASAPFEQCTMRSGGVGLRTRLDLRAPLPAGAGSLASTLDAAAAVLIRQGLTLVESGVPGTLLGQRDGLTVTVGSDGRVFELDAITGCRPR